MNGNIFAYIYVFPNLRKVDNFTDLNRISSVTGLLYKYEFFFALSTISQEIYITRKYVCRENCLHLQYMPLLKFREKKLSLYLFGARSTVHPTSSTNMDQLMSTCISLFV